MSSPVVQRLVRAHEAYAKRQGYEHEPPPPFTADDLRAIEDVAGVKIPGALAELWTTPKAVPWFGVGVDDYLISEWLETPAAVIEKIRDFRKAREEYDWDLPDLLPIGADEDYVAVLEGGKVAQICNNEGNFEDEEPMGVTTVEALIDRCCALFEAHVAEHAENEG